MLTILEFSDAVMRDRDRRRSRTVYLDELGRQIADLDPRGRCPRCGADLRPVSGVVIASRHCPTCGGRVLAEADVPDDGPDELLSVAEFVGAADRWWHWQRWIAKYGTVIWLASILFTLVVNNAVIVPLPDDVSAGMLIWSFVCPPVFVAIALRLLERRAKADDRVNCWACDRPLWDAPTVVSATGCCPACGEQVIDLPDRIEPPRPDAVVPTVRELVARVAARRWYDRHRERWYRLASLLAVGVILCGVGKTVGERNEDRWAAQIACYRMQWVALYLLAAIAGASGYLLVIGWSVWRRGRADQRFLPVCKHCGLMYPDPGLVIAARRCPRCRRLDAVPAGDDPC